MKVNSDLSIVMPFRNEGKEPLMTVKSILESCNLSEIEILAINDCGDDEIDFSAFPLVRYIQNKKRLGVTECRDFGVDEAKSDNILIIDAHMRFRKDNWAEKGIALVEQNPQSILFTKSVDIGSGHFDLSQTLLPMNHGLPYYSGCGLKLFLTHSDNPLRSENHRNIIESKWLEERQEKIYPVPCLMGANYFFKKSWYQKLHGFKGMKTWGNSEPFLSFKSWFAGGDVKFTKEIEIGHLYRNKNPNAVLKAHIIYNKFITAKILFNHGLTNDLIEFMGTKPEVDNAKKMLEINAEEIETERQYFQSIAKLSSLECFQKMKVDFRNPSKRNL